MDKNVAVHISQQDEISRVMRKFNFITNGGKNHDGVSVLVCHACRIPSVDSFTTDLDDLKLYAKTKIEAFKDEEDGYAIVYFHAGLPHSPPMGFLQEIHTGLDHETRKKLKAVYLVHPTDSLATLVALAKRFVSPKVWEKVHFVPDLKTLRSYVILELIEVDKEVKKEDLCRKWSWNGWGLW